MANNTNPTRFLDSLARFLYETSEGEPGTDCRADLLEDDVDVGRLKVRVQTLIENKKGQLRLLAAKEQYKQTAQALQNNTDRPNKSLPIKERLNALLDRLNILQPQAVGAWYQRYQGTDENDLESLVDELETLVLLKQHERNQ